MLLTNENKPLLLTAFLVPSELYLWVTKSCLVL